MWVSATGQFYDASGARSPGASFFRQACAARLDSQSPARMSHVTPSHDDVVHSESFLRSLMHRQLKLSVASAATFLIVLLGLPLLNYYAPALMATRVAGFTLSWLVLGVLFFPFVWVISWLFIRRSIALEQDEVAQVAGRTQPAGKEGR
jgi:uncharacterized membrane protein (DUF485 family)